MVEGLLHAFVKLFDCMRVFFLLFYLFFWLYTRACHSKSHINWLQMHVIKACLLLYLTN